MVLPEALMLGVVTELEKQGSEKRNRLLGAAAGGSAMAAHKAGLLAAGAGKAAGTGAAAAGKGAALAKAIGAGLATAGKGAAAAATGPVGATLLAAAAGHQAVKHRKKIKRALKKGTSKVLDYAAGV